MQISSADAPPVDVLDQPFRIGPATRVRPSLHHIERDGHTAKVEPRLMRVLCVLAARPGEVVSREALLQTVWPDALVQDEALTQAVSRLRRALGDRARDARVIETIPKAGYRLVAPVTLAADAAVPPSASVLWPRRALWAALTAALLAVAAVALWTWRSEAAAPSPQPLPLTTLRGLEFDPAISPDGQRFVFAWNRGEGDATGLFIKQIGSEAPVALTDAGGRDRHPAWSPDGRQIAFSRALGGERALYVLPAIGGAARRVHTCQADRGTPLAWTPDGQGLVFSDAEAGAPLRLMRVGLGGREAVPLTRPPAGSIGDGQPVFSPDGQRLAFVRVTLEGIADVYVVEDGAPRRVTTWEREVLGLAWAADGRTLLAASLLDGGYRLWQIPLDGSEPRPLYVGTEPLYEVDVSPATGQIVYTASDVEVNVWRLSLADGTREPVVASTTWDSNPRLSPDGRRLAFSSVREVTPEIWVSDADGEEMRRLTHFGGPYVGPPAWAPDGSRLAFDARADGQADLYLAPLAGGPLERLTDTPHDEVNAAWSGDGERLYYASNQTGTWQLHALSLADGSSRPVTEAGGYAAMESPDGATLYFTRRDADGLWQKPLPDGPETRLLPYPSATNWGAWDVTAEGLAAVRDAEGPELVRVDPVTGREMARVPIPGRLPGGQRVLSVAPDGRSFLYSHVERLESDLTRVVWGAPF